MSEQASISTPSKLYSAMIDNWALVDALFGGTKTMRAAATTYLPKEPGESDVAYTMRLNRTFLFPGFKRTVQALVGKVFSKPIAVREDAPDKVKEWAKDIDLTGRTIESFAQEAFELAIRKGVVHIHADFPRVANAGDMTLADEREAGNRPYLRIVDPNDVIWWWSDRVSGVERLLEVRIRETVREKDGDYGEKFVNQIRVLTPGHFKVYRKIKDGTEDKWTVHQEGAVTYAQEIPWATVYTGREGFMRATPPLLELANLNTSHWQSASDQRNILRVARVPFLFGSGFKDGELAGKEGKFELGANRAVTAQDPKSDMKYVEHTGAAIEAGRDDLEDLKADMAALGFELLVRRPGNETATARSISTAEVNSALAAMAIEMRGGLSKALNTMLKWGGSKTEATQDELLDINTDYGLSTQGQEELDIILKARLQGDISRETFWSEMKRRGLLQEDFDAEAETELLKQEMGPPGNEDDLDLGGDK